jgi:ElaB/YqjD/DUF883 family membrane-anchored ribosome-binding protein
MSHKRGETVTPLPEMVEPSKAQLQRRMEEARESIAHTVEEIKETVTDQVETVKETVSNVLDWNEHFTKNPLVWGAAAVGAGLVIGYSIAAMREGEHHSRRRRAGASVTDSLFAELATVGENILLPAVNDRIKDLFGIDLSEHLFHHREPTPRRVSGKKSSQKGAAKKGAAKKKAARKQPAKKKAE